MSELSPHIGWFFAAVGLVPALFVGRAMRGRKALGSVVATAILSSLLSGILVFCTSAAQTFCVERLSRCSSAGDGNVSFWLYPLYALPIYWLCMLAWPASSNERA